ncbi:MAG: hypothetical protein IJH61_06520 [Eubacteriaceae bacterium]|nr:hypothetical protein [Eubacteriaceae bacterium]
MIADKPRISSAAARRSNLEERTKNTRRCRVKKENHFYNPEMNGSFREQSVEPAAKVNQETFALSSRRGEPCSKRLFERWKEGIGRFESVRFTYRFSIVSEGGRRKRQIEKPPFKPRKVIDI